MKTVLVGTRGSRLAIAQTEIALAALRKVHPQIRFEVIAISTKGDVDKRPLFSLRGQAQTMCLLHTMDKN
jgi:hydroxymethylbilane synthase